VARTVLVTGGNRGIGFAIAQAFVKQGDRVAITHRGTFDQASAPEILGVTCDITDSAAVDTAFTTIENELGPVEVLVANAGITADTLLMRMSEEQFSSVVDTNLTGAWRCARRASTKMVRGRWGRMIFISSVVGLYGGAGQVNYAASKAGLVGLTRTMALELAPAGVLVNAVAPGYVATDLTRQNNSPAKLAEIEALIPVGRLAEPGEIAELIAFLCSARNSYVTGQVVVCDGGYTCR
jgi:NAD(P)-dependent dehydrogenase (short-subunit alcohol dehydrogenase family)